MPDEVITKTNADSTPGACQTGQNANSICSHLIVFCAAGLAVSFFLPWVNFWLGNPSGFDLQKTGGEQRLLWLIPVFCIITIVAGVTKYNQKPIAIFTGALPFATGAYWYSQIGTDLFHMLTYGAYLSLIFGTALLVLPWIKFKRQP
jgi:hypothetical protein